MKLMFNEFKVTVETKAGKQVSAILGFDPQNIYDALLGVEVRILAREVLGERLDESPSPSRLAARLVSASQWGV